MIRLKMKYIFLEDIKSIVDFVQLNNIDCTCLHVDVNKKDNYEIVKNIISDTEGNKSVTIITDFGIKTIEEKTGKLFKDDEVSKIEIPELHREVCRDEWCGGEW